MSDIASFNGIDDVEVHIDDVEDVAANVESPAFLGKGDPGKDGASIVAITKGQTVGDTTTYIITMSDGNEFYFEVKTAKGDPGEPGEPGADGVGVQSATINSSGHLILTLTDGTVVDCGNAKGAKGDTGAAGAKGDTGATGADGEDGISVTGASINASGHLIITLSNGTTVDAGVAKGAKGDTGSPGQNGADGADGADGVSPAVSISSITGGHRVSITDKAHPSGQNFDVMDGEDGAPGSPGTPGAAGKSAYASAQDGGYSGTEAQFNTDLSAVSTKYSKPSGGIPKTDLASAVQTSLDKADSALQQHQSLAAYRTAAAQDIIDGGKLDKLQGVAHTGEFLVVGSDGNVTTRTLSAWEGGSY